MALLSPWLLHGDIFRSLHLCWPSPPSRVSGPCCSGPALGLMVARYPFSHARGVCACITGHRKWPIVCALLRWLFPTPSHDPTNPFTVPVIGTRGPFPVCALSYPGILLIDTCGEQPWASISQVEVR